MNDDEDAPQSPFDQHQEENDEKEGGEAQEQTIISARSIPRSKSTSKPMLPLKSATPTSRIPRASFTASSASVDQRNDKEIITDAIAHREPSTIESLDLSDSSKRLKKSLKSLQSLMNLTFLKHLDASNHALVSFDGIESLVELRTLHLSRNHLKRIDPSISSLQQLRVLNLSGNFISHIPKMLNALASLEILNLSGNNLAVLKELDVLASLSNLHDCNFSANPFCKLPTSGMRDKSRRRFQDALMAKDATLRQVGLAHEQEQNKLRELQEQLEEENMRLKGELQVKSKLLQNKSKEWSSATEQLLQLQQAIAMMNLERRPTQSKSTVVISPPLSPTSPTASVDSFDGRRYEANAMATSMESMRLGPLSPPPLQQKDRYGRKPMMYPEDEYHQLRPTTPPAVSQYKKEAVRTLASEQALERRLNEMSQRLPVQRPTTDSATSPVYEAWNSKSYQEEPVPPQRSTSMDAIRPAIVHLSTPSPMVVNALQREEEDYDTLRRQEEDPAYLAFPSIEDDVACPAYEDLHEVRSSWSSHSQEPSKPRLHWFPQTSSAQPFETSTGLASGIMTPLHPTEKDALVRYIQALQTKKVNLLTEITREEKLLQVLKQESTAVLDQMERLTANIEARLATQSPLTEDAKPSDPPLSPRSAKEVQTQRQEEADRAKLEVLRNKLRFAENKEKEIETTIVRLTKHVLQQDMKRSGNHGDNAVFDKEIFALTHKLQLVIVQKEEIHLEMSRLMARMRADHMNRAPAQGEDEATRPHIFTTREEEERDEALAMDRQALEELNRRYHEIMERIRIKEELISALVRELKALEREMLQINTMSPGRRATVDGSSALFTSVMKRIEEGEESTEKRDAILHLDALLHGNKTVNPAADDTTSMDCNASVSEPPSMKPSEAPITAAEKKEPAPAVDSTDVATEETPSVVPLELKFKELLTHEMLEEIKKDIFDKLSKQLAEVQSVGKPKTPQEERSEFHQAIATALETQMRLAMERFQKKKGEDEQQKAKQQQQQETATSPMPSKRSIGKTPMKPVNPIVPAPVIKDDEVCWDQLEDFEPIDGRYAMKYRFVKHRAVASNSPGSSERKSARVAGAQRILKACERLESAERDCRLDPISGIEIDSFGRKKSHLKILLMAARDLPTAHLRTKNLDPYVTMEVIYPDHVVAPLSKAASNHQHQQAQEAPLIRRSRTKKKSLYPVWDEEFDFTPILSLKGYLVIRVLNDRKLSREQVIGETRIPLRSLLHQKKTVEWFSLRRIVSTPSMNSRPNTTVLKACGGAIRLQLQLQFSKVEKLKRTVDELVTKFFHEHNQLPAFIERVGQLEKKPKRPEDDDDDDTDDLKETKDRGMKPLFALQQEIEAQELKTKKKKAIPPPIITNFPLEELEGSLEKYDRWRESVKTEANKNESCVNTSHTRVMSACCNCACASSSSVSSSTSRVNNNSAEQWQQQRSPVPFASSLLHQPLPTHKNVTKATNTTPNKIKTSPSPTIVHHRMATNNNNQHRKSPQTLRAVKLPKSNQLRNSFPWPSIKSSSDLSPECFDEYSLYHPDHLTQLHGGTVTCGRPRKFVLPSSAWEKTTDSNKTGDLRIFKSPGFGRREPTQGFPERYIGLDNQTCERLKRMFGRMDAVGNN